VRGAGLPLVVTVHDLLPLRMPQWFTRETRAHARLTLPFLRRADHLLTNSDWTRDEVLDLLGVAPERVTVTPFGVAPRFGPREVDRERLAARYGIEGRYVLCVGTREPRKNLGFAARAFDLVAADVPDCELVVTGAPGWGLDESAHHGARIRRTGFVSDEELVDLYAGAACFFFPSLAEGFGFPPLEAMACGAPVVSSERRAMADVLGDAALLVDPTDAEAAAAALRRVLGDEELAGRLRDAGLRRAGELTWERCAQATADAYAVAVASTRS
jgi:alpha-1,3-rhamnosyl/mannosyltransferase